MLRCSTNSPGNKKHFYHGTSCIKLSSSSDLEVNKIFSFLNFPPKTSVFLMVQKITFFSRIRLLLPHDFSHPSIQYVYLNHCRLISWLYLWIPHSSFLLYKFRIQSYFILLHMWRLIWNKSRLKKDSWLRILKGSLRFKRQRLHKHIFQSNFVRNKALPWSCVDMCIHELWRCARWPHLVKYCY
jgi:hypothetical protein